MATADPGLPGNIGAPATRALAAAGLITLADKGYIGAGQHVLVPYRGRGKPASQ